MSDNSSGSDSKSSTKPKHKAALPPPQPLPEEGDKSDQASLARVNIMIIEQEIFALSRNLEKNREQIAEEFPDFKF
jgi:hypothetical protein